MNPLDCRVYDKINKKIVEVISYDFIEGGLQVVEIGKESTKNNIYLLGPEEYILLSFTGKLDIDNKKIYLGDIVERTSKVEYEDYIDKCVDTGEVVYQEDECRFFIRCSGECAETYYIYYKNFVNHFTDEESFDYNVTYKRLKSKYE